MKKTIKKNDLSKKIYNKAEREGKRGYRIEFDEKSDGKLVPARFVLIEKNGAEAAMSFGDVATLIFGEIDKQMRDYHVENMVKKVAKVEKKKKK